MRITDFLQKDCIKVPMSAKTREEAIDELLTLLSAKHGIPSPEKIAKKIKTREEDYPYYPRPGIAAPHIVNELVPRKIVAVGKCSPLIDWKVKDRPPVSFVFLVIGPKGEVLNEILTTLSETFDNPATREYLFKCETTSHVYDFLHKVGVDLGAPDGFKLESITDRIPGAVLSMAWSPDGNKIASVGAGPNHQVYIWDNGRRIHSLPGHRGEVRGVAWSPDGRFIASGSDDMTVRIYDTDTFELITVFDNRAKIHGIAWSLDSATIAVAGHTQGVHRFNTRGQQQLRQLRGMDQFEPAYCISLSPDGKLLAAGGGRMRPSILVWNAYTENLSEELTIDSDMILSIAWSPNCTLLAVGLSNGSVQIWDTNTWREHKVLRGHSDIVTAVRFSWQGDFLASKSADGTVCLWNCDTWKEVARMPDPGTGALLFAPLAFHPRALKLATLGRSGNAIRIWILSPNEMQPLRPISPGITQPLKIPHALIEAVSNHDSVLFAGAGFSAGSVGVTGNTLKDEIGGIIQKDFSNYDYSTRSFEEVADDYVAVNDLQGLLNRLVSFIPQDTPTSQAHIGAVKMFPHIITTNWDLLFEAAYRQCRQNRQILVENTDSNNFHPDKYSLIKMHGTADRPHSLVATSHQIDTYHISHCKLLERISDLLFGNTVLFVGYNMQEAHIRRILASILCDRGLFVRKAYAVGFFDEVSTIRFKKREIEVIECEAGQFIMELAKNAGF